jgi:CBS domain containing-hemolysin-like protein
VSVVAVLVAVGLLAANGFFVAAEFALLAARRSRMDQLAEQGNLRARQAAKGVRELTLMLAGAQLGITMASLGLGAVAEPAVARGLEQLLGLGMPAGPARHGIAVAIALSVVVFLHMVVGEMAPKSWAITHPEQSALAIAAPFRAVIWPLRPFIHLLNAAANGVVRLCGVEPSRELAVPHTPADLLVLLEESARAGELEHLHRDLMAKALDLSRLDAEASMVPRTDIVAVGPDAGVEELERVASETGRSRLPVYDAEGDRVLGVLHVKDLLPLEGPERHGVTAAALARPALVTPESRAVPELMLDMREQRQHIAIVVDEFGTITGLVSLEDLLEELIGEFEDETDLPLFTARGRLSVPGALRPDELEVRAGVRLPDGPWETVAGFVLARLGRLAEPGDAVDVPGARIEVTAVEGHRIVEVSVRRLPTLQPPPTDQ